MILALCGDYRVGATEGKLGLTELRAGIPYPAVAMEVVRAELGPAAVRMLVLGASLVEPREALELRLVDELAPAAAVLDRALVVAAELAALPTAGYPLVKRQLRGEAMARMERAQRDDPLLGGWLGEETGTAAAGVLGAERSD
jgi:enoyl-CoA hydratase